MNVTTRGALPLVGDAEKFAATGPVPTSENVPLPEIRLTMRRAFVAIEGVKLNESATPEPASVPDARRIGVPYALGVQL